MKKYIYILSSLIALGLMASSCDLTEAPQAEAGRAIIFGDEAGLRNYCYGFSPTMIMLLKSIQRTITQQR